MLKEIAECFTKVEIQALLNKCNDEDHHASWLKEKLVDKLLTHDKDTVLGFFTVNQLKEGLKVLEKSTEGTKEELLKRLNEAIKFN